MAEVVTKWFKFYADSGICCCRDEEIVPVDLPADATPEEQEALVRIELVAWGAEKMELSSEEVGGEDG